MADFERDVLELVPRLRRFARSLCRDSGDAEDLVQDSLERAFAHRGQFRGADLRAWLNAIMINCFRSGLRRSRAGPAIVGLDDNAGTADAADPLARTGIARAVLRLDPDQRAVLMLVVVEGYRYAEVAQMLAVPVGTVMSRLSRARRALAESLEGANIVELRRNR
jgi:RNA polymerase sigma-70 factor (ECF subfamily)